MWKRAPVHSSRLVRAADALLRAMPPDGDPRAVLAVRLSERHTGGREFTPAERAEAIAFLVRLGVVGAPVGEG